MQQPSTQDQTIVISNKNKKKKKKKTFVNSKTMQLEKSRKWYMKHKFIPLSTYT